jgi:hypothetical protein
LIFPQTGFSAMAHALAQSTGRVSTSAENRVSLAILLAVGHFQANPKTQVAAFHDVVTYASR